MNRKHTLTQYMPNFAGGWQPEVATVVTLADLERIPWVQMWRDHPEGFYRFSAATVNGQSALMAETAFGLKAWTVGVFDSPLEGLPEWRRRAPPLMWTAIVPGDLPTKRLILRSAAIDFRRAVERFGTTPFVSDGKGHYWDRAAAKARSAGQNYYGPYIGFRLADHEIELQVYGDDDFTPKAELHQSTFIVAYLIELSQRTLEWQAYSCYEDSGEASDVIRGDGPDLVRRLDVPPLFPQRTPPAAPRFQSYTLFLVRDLRTGRVKHHEVFESASVPPNTVPERIVRRLRELTAVYDVRAYETIAEGHDSIASIRHNYPELTANERTVILGPEHDQRLRHITQEVLARLGAVPQSSDWSLAGSQELEMLELRMGVAPLVLEAETFVGLSLRGPALVVDVIAAAVGEELAKPAS